MLNQRQQRLSEFISEVLLAEIQQNIVIFVDEIDSVLSLDFPIDDFFAFIRSCYNQRVDKPAYRRLTCALFGVANPSDLIRDKTRTPFNIGRVIQLQGFQFEEAQPLVRGLADKAARPQVVLQSILDWTGGQPFLTQKLCWLVIVSDSSIPEVEEPSWIKQLVRSRLIENWEAQDEPEHLRIIGDRLLRNEWWSGRLLGLYRQILQQGAITADNSSEQMELQLAGLVVNRDGMLCVQNRIYEAVFNEAWVERALSWLRPYASDIKAWEASGRQDNSRLLQGQALRDAQLWAANKNLSAQDYQFLLAGENLERQEMQEKLDAQANQANKRWWRWSKK